MSIQLHVHTFLHDSTFSMWFYMHKANSVCICACKTPENRALVTQSGPGSPLGFKNCFVYLQLDLFKPKFKKEQIKQIFGSSSHETEKPMLKIGLSNFKGASDNILTLSFWLNFIYIIQQVTTNLHIQKEKLKNLL